MYSLKRNRIVLNYCRDAKTAWMTSSWEGKSRWPGVVLGKIKSLWSTTQGTANDGLNQLIAPPGKDESLNELVTPVRKVNNQFSPIVRITGRRFFSTCGKKLFDCVLLCSFFFFFWIV